ncbi:MAG: class I SAM-dependent methyltransferase [Chloroflexi bacterium]|nr:class I SAM-dependent methyltransferase [Chloroflexota bacterium]
MVSLLGPLMWRVREVRNPNSLISRLRRERFRLFLETMEPKAMDLILDVGSSSGHGLEVFDRGAHRVVGLDLTRPKENANVFDSFVVGNGCYLPFKTQALDIVFCNAVLEHVTTWEGQQQIAREMLRTGKRLFVCTNNRYFPIEPHYMLPLFQFVPEPVQKRVVKWVSVGLPRKHWERIRLLSKGELQTLFPGCRIYAEKLFGLAFSWIVVKR